VHLTAKLCYRFIVFIVKLSHRYYTTFCCVLHSRFVSLLYWFKNKLCKCISIAAKKWNSYLARIYILSARKWFENDLSTKKHLRTLMVCYTFVGTTRQLLDITVFNSEIRARIEGVLLKQFKGKLNDKMDYDTSIYHNYQYIQLLIYIRVFSKRWEDIHFFHIIFFFLS